jgi:hypothetical protein
LTWPEPTSIGGQKLNSRINHQDLVSGANDTGYVTGSYLDSGNTYHWFLRSPNGVVTSFDPQGSTATFSQSINDKGVVAGDFEDGNGIYHAFIRAADATFTIFDPANSTGTRVTGINDRGSVIGSYGDASGPQRGYVRAANGKIVAFDPAGSTATTDAEGINNGGTITGAYITNDGSFGNCSRSCWQHSAIES